MTKPESIQALDIEIHKKISTTTNNIDVWWFVSVFTTQDDLFEDLFDQKKMLRTSRPHAPSPPLRPGLCGKSRKLNAFPSRKGLPFLAHHAPINCYPRIKRGSPLLHCWRRTTRPTTCSSPSPSSILLHHLQRKWVSSRQWTSIHKPHLQNIEPMHVH